MCGREGALHGVTGKRPPWSTQGLAWPMQHTRAVAAAEGSEACSNGGREASEVGQSKGVS